MARDSSRSFWSAFAPKSWPFWAIHLLAIAGVAATGWSWSGLALALALYGIRMFWVTIGYHRYFSHRSFRTSRPFQLWLAIAAESSAQKGILWWAAHHRVHHKMSDKPGDLHSVKLDGFWWSHVGWLTSREYEATDLDRVKDLARYPELRFIDRWWWLPPLALAAGLGLAGGWHALLWGFFVSTVLLWHGTFTVNSLTHVFGRRRYATDDESRNSLLIALITFGEGWHNNHHHYMTSANQGFHWWQIDLSYYGLWMLSRVGLIWDVRVAPQHVVRGDAVRGAARPAPVTAAALPADSMQARERR